MYPIYVSSGKGGMAGVREATRLRQDIGPYYTAALPRETGGSATSDGQETCDHGGRGSLRDRAPFKRPGRQPPQGAGFAQGQRARRVPLLTGYRLCRGQRDGCNGGAITGSTTLP